MKEQSKITKVSTPDLITCRIRDMILQGTWAPGSKIPSEGNLADYFGVNRLTVRIALQKLNALGILDTRVGDGTYACQFDFDQYFDEVADFYVTPQALSDVKEFRAILEIEACRLAMERATPEEFDTLYYWAEQIERSNDFLIRDSLKNMTPAEIKQKVEITNAADMEFHRQICIMSHNALILNAFSLERPVIIRHIEFLYSQRITTPSVEQADSSIKRHWAIYSAIKDKDFEACRKNYLDMLNEKIL